MTTTAVESPSDQVPHDTVTWIEGAVGARVVSARRFPRARDTWWIETGAAAAPSARWLLKGRRAPAHVMARSRILSDFGAAREAAAMTALADTTVRVPRLGGFDDASAQLLIERIEGSALIHRAPTAERRAAVTDYARQLAALHRLAWQELPLGAAISAPTSRHDMALGGWLRSAEADAATALPRLRHAEPLLRLLVSWLHENVPVDRGTDHVRLLHGDAGVTNFLSVGGRVTALIDWELAILGDPMSDLGNARYREALYPSGTYADLIGAYEDATGVAVDASAIGYYTALAATVLSLGMVANVHHPRARQPEAVARVWQDALARSIACEAVCEAEGIALDYDDPGESTSSFDPLVELLIDRMQAQAADGNTEHGYAQLARAVQNATRSGSSVDAALCQEVGEITGRAVAGVDDALAAADTQIDSADPELRRRLLVVLARDARRRLAVLSPLRDAEVWEDAAPASSAPTPPFVLPSLRVRPDDE